MTLRTASLALVDSGRYALAEKGVRMQYMKLDTEDRRALIRELASLPTVLQRAFAGLSAEEARLPGPSGSFSPVEQVWHLADLESEGFGERLRRLLEETSPALPDFDGAAVARARDYRSRSLDEGLQRFAEARAANLARLAALTEDDWWRSGTQSGVGEVSVCDIPMFMRQHDAAHVIEIREWQALRGV